MTLGSRKLRKQKRVNSAPTLYAAILENEKTLGMRLQRAFPADNSRHLLHHTNFFFHHAIRFLGHLWLRLRVVPHFSSGIVERAKRERAWTDYPTREKAIRPLEGVPPPPRGGDAQLSNGNTFLEMSSQEANENSRENLYLFWSYPPLIKTIHAFIIPLLCHFSKKGQQNAQNT